MLQVWFFATPIVYPSSVVAPRYRWLLDINPVAPLVDATRAVLFGHAPNLRGLGLAAATTTVVVLISSLYFRQVERTFADVI